MKLNVKDVNCDKMIDRPVYSDRVRVTMRRNGPLKTQFYDVIVGHFYYTSTCSSTTHLKVCTFYVYIL